MRRRKSPGIRRKPGTRRFLEAVRRLGDDASLGGGAARVGAPVLACAVLLLCSCTTPTLRIHHGPAPSETEHFCAWYGNERDGILYFGQSAFWWASRRGSPATVLDHPGPAPIGRFDLASARLLESLEVGGPEDRSGVWDVLAHPNRRVYFTTFFGSAGWVDLATDEVIRLPELGDGLNEIAPGPDGTLLASRYFGSDGSGGSVVVIDLEGRLVAEHPLRAPAGFLSAPKTPAWDPRHQRIWVTADILPEGSDPGDAAAIRRGAYVLDVNGRQLAYTEQPEIQFVAFGPDGTGYRTEVSGSELALRIVAPDAVDPRIEAGRRIVLDPAFPAKLDFAQDLQILPDGRVVVTRWGGTIHIVRPAGEVRTVSLPRASVDGLYYTGVIGEGRLCATHCGGIEIVCTPDEAP
jgi:hypothetical protein